MDRDRDRTRTGIGDDWSDWVGYEVPIVKKTWMQRQGVFWIWCDGIGPLELCCYFAARALLGCVMSRSELSIWKLDG